MKLSKKAMTAASAFGAVALLALGATSASAAVTTEAYVDASSGTWDPTAIVGSASAATTVSVDGDGFTGSTAVVADNGVYIAFGGADFTATDRNYYHSAAWASSTSGATVGLSGGSFTGAPVEVVQSYGDIDCFTDASDTTGEQCYVYTFSGWGIFPNAANDPNYTQVPVYFE